MIRALSITLAAAFWLQAFWLQPAASAQWTDSFEGGEPRWELVESDCQAQLTEHGISLLMPHGGRTCEMFELSTTHGTLALLAYPIEPCAILNEFRPRLWTRCSSARLQLGVRVIFPFASHPVTEGRLNTILWGNMYSDTGQWQMLEVPGMIERLREETVALRQKFGADLNLEGAYIDCLVLNAYTGPGRYRVQLDDLDLRGMIPMAATGNPPPANWRERWRWRYAVPSAEERYWAAPNRPATWLQYRGESLPWIESLGFSGVVASELPSPQWLAETRQANLNVICPPPPYAVDYPEELLPTLRGWLIGAALDTKQTSLARDQAQRVAQLPASLQKPLIAEALEDYFFYSRLADELIVPAPIPTSAGLPQEKADWLSHKLTTVKQRSEGWVSIDVGIHPPLAQQIESARAIVESADTGGSESVANPLGTRHQVTAAVMAGAKGLLLRTFKPLDLQSTGDIAQIAALRWIHSDLQLWGPWIMGGQSVQPPGLNQTHWQSAAWRISQSHLIIAQTMADGSQYCVPATASAPLAFDYALPAVGQQVFRLTQGTLERVETRTTPAGIQWTVDRPASTESFVITSNPNVMKFLRERQSATAAQLAADQLEIASYNLGLAARVIEARFQPAASAEGRPFTGPQARQLELAQRRLDQGWQALRTDQPQTATGFMYRASDNIQAILFDAFQAASSNLSTPQSSPFVVTPAALSLHWKLADACERSHWNDLSLPGSELKNLNAMLAAGWSQQRRLEDRVDLRVELLPSSVDRAPGLRMAAYAKAGTPDQVAGGYEGAALRIRSASVPVQAGSLVRVAAKARIIRAGRDAGSGLLIYDNQLGPSQGQLVTGSPGQTVAIELYRFIVEEGDFRLLAECRGECDIVIDSIQASVIQPAANHRRFPTFPVDTLPFGVPNVTEIP